MLKAQVLGFIYLISNPSQLKHLIIRETRYKHRFQSKQNWMKWQKYNSARMKAALQKFSVEAFERPFNLARIQTISDLVSHVGKGLRVLDVGGGDGVIGEHILKMGNHLTSIDLPTVVTQAQKCKGLLAVGGDAEQLPFISNTFDVILASEIVEHLWDPHSFVEEAYRVLKPNGHLIISTPEGKDSLRYDSHKNYYTVERLTHLLNEKFDAIEVRRMKPAGIPTPTLILLFQKSEYPKN